MPSLNLAQDLHLAHRVAMRIVDLIADASKLASPLLRGMSPTDKRLGELIRLRQELGAALEEAETDLLPQLPEFACVNPEPFQHHKFIVTSGHQAALKVGRWLHGLKLTPDKFEEFFEKYYRAGEDGARGQIDWNAVRAADDHTLEVVREFDLYPAAHHRALLEMEIAKTAKAVSAPRWVPELDFDEECILDAVGNQKLVWHRIRDKAGFTDWSEAKTRGRLSQMKKRGLLVNERDGEGYSRGPLADAALRQADAGKA